MHTTDSRKKHGSHGAEVTVERVLCSKSMGFEHFEYGELRESSSRHRQAVVSTGYNSTHTTQHGTSLYGHNSTPHNSKRPQFDTAQLNIPQLDTPQFDTSQLDTLQLYTDHMAVWLKLLYSSERYEQSVNVITLRQKSRNTNNTFARTVRCSIVALTLRPYGLSRVAVCRVVVV